MTLFQFIGACTDGERFLIDGVNVWDHQWISRKGESAHVTDPHHGQAFTFDVFDINAGQRHITFAAGEFSNGVWGFYAPTA